MDYNEIHPILLQILTSIITGGFVLVFVEIGNRKNRENDRYFQLLSPFMHKLSAYLRFITWCRCNIEYPKDKDEKEKNFHTLVSKVSRKAMITGSDYPVGHFSANELDKMADDINNIWYWHDKMRPCSLKWREGFENEIKKELREINPIYLSDDLDINLIAKVSGEFYVDCYQKVELELFRHEAISRLYRKHALIVSSAGVFVLLMLGIMLFVHLPVCLMQIIGVIVILLLISSMLLLGLDEERQIDLLNKISNKFRKKKSHI